MANQEVNQPAEGQDQQLGLWLEEPLTASASAAETASPVEEPNPSHVHRAIDFACNIGKVVANGGGMELLRNLPNIKQF